MTSGRFGGKFNGKFSKSVKSTLGGPVPLQRCDKPRSGRWLVAAAGAMLTLLLPACGEQPETAVKTAKAGDLIVKSGQTHVELLAPFKPGVANGLYKGVIRVSQPDAPSRLYRANAVCSMKDEPGWPDYDNLFADPIANLKQASMPGASPKRWQVFYHFDGRVEPSAKLAPEPWMARLKDNICRRGDFDDSARSGAPGS